MSAKEQLKALLAARQPSAKEQLRQLLLEKQGDSKAPAIAPPSDAAGIRGSVEPVDPDDFGARAKRLDPTGLSIARAKNDEFGQYLRDQASRPVPGESEEQRFKRLHGGLSERGRSNDKLRAGFQGYSYGAGDEIVAGGAAALNKLTGKDSGRGIGELYDAYLSRERGDLESYRDESPVEALAAEAGGAVVNPVSWMAPQAVAAKGTSLLSKAATSAGVAAPAGFAYGFNSGEGGTSNRMASGGTGALAASFVGGAAPAFGALAKHIAKSKAKSSAMRELKKLAPSAEQLRAKATVAYDKARNSGVIVKSFDRALADLGEEARKFGGFNEKLMPQITGALEELGQAKGQPVGLDDLETMRRILGSAAKGGNDAEKALASSLIGKLDEFVDGLKPADLGSGTKQATKLFKEARGLYHRTAKVQTLEELVELAGVRAGGNYTGSGFENALRTEFTNLARAIIKKQPRGRGFSKAEKEAILKVAEGGKLDNALRMLGRFSLRGPIGGLTGGAVALTPAGAPGMAALWGAGELGRRGATKMTMRNVDMAKALAASGGAPKIAANPNAQLLGEALTRRAAVPAAPYGDDVLMP